MRDFGHIWTVCKGHQICALSFFAPPSTLKFSTSHTSAAFTSPTPRCGVGIVTSQASKESMYRHTTAVISTTLSEKHFVRKYNFRVYTLPAKMFLRRLRWCQSAFTVNESHVKYSAAAVSNLCKKDIRSSTYGRRSERATLTKVK